MFNYGHFERTEIFLSVRWIFDVVSRWPVCLNVRINILIQSVHTAIISTHLHPQPCQLQAKGFSPVCLLRWAFRWLLLVYILVQPGKVHLCILIRSATGFFWNFWPPTRIPDPWLAEPSPSPRGLAAMGTGAMRTNLEETLRLGEGRMWGTRAKVWPWMLTRSCAILMSEAGDGCGGWATGVRGATEGSCLIWRGWICRMTGIPLLFVPLSADEGLLADAFLAPVLDSCVGLTDVVLVSLEAAVARPAVLAVGTVWSEYLASGSSLGSGVASLHHSRPTSRPRASSSPTPNPGQPSRISCFIVTTSIFSSRNSSISSSVGWKDPPSCSSVSTLDQVRKSKFSSFMGSRLEGSSLRESQKKVDNGIGTDPASTVLAPPKEAWDSRWSKMLSWLSALELLP